MAARFEWDAQKAKTNQQKHQIDFEEASTIFADPQFITFLDDEHSQDEERYISIGLSNMKRVLMVAHSERKNKTRIISARKATEYEEKFYQETG